MTHSFVRVMSTQIDDTTHFVDDHDGQEKTASANKDMSTAGIDGARPASSSATECFEYIFGFGSIINNSTHAPWLSSNNVNNASLPGIVVTLTKQFGYERQWNFRSSTGFTALGVLQASSAAQADDINGVLFRVPQSMMPGFDRREVGYRKVSIPLECLEFHDNNDNGNEDANDSDDMDNNNAPIISLNRLRKNEIGPTDRLWIYVPLSSHCKAADENHPLLQSYVDTVLQGCLEWGGQAMAEKFVLTTGGWSTYFLNDTPSSRRPWLFRKDYSTIDMLLQKYATKTHFDDRKHPEEFSSAFHRRMKGSWSLPRRNQNFTGRERELKELRGRFVQDGALNDGSGSSGKGGASVVVKVEVAGMGGVGKTQLVTEYCYRFYPSEYGLVVWLNAESAEGLVADYRQLLMDLAQEDASEVTKSSPVVSSSSSPGGAAVSAAASATQDSTDEIIREVKTRLFRSQVPWLLVFDNLEDRDLLSTFVPRGAGTRGHILVTTRQYEMDSTINGSSSGSLLLGCFDPSESLELLRRSAGPENIDGNANVVAATQICARLGHLPLALGMASAYMKRCDVQCKEYLDRYSASEKSGQSLLRHGKLQDYSLSVASSLALSLVAIEKESKVAFGILRVLCFLGPDHISKSLLRQLLSSASQMDIDISDPFIKDDQSLWNREFESTVPFVISSCCTLLAFTAFKRRFPRVLTRKRDVVAIVPALTATSLVFAMAWSRASIGATRSSSQSRRQRHKIRRSSSLNAFSSSEYEQADIVWDILKSFSILSIREGRGCMHRLLAHALRSSQTPVEWRHNLRICLNAMETLWTFKAEESKTWKDAVCVLEHLKSVVSHANSCGFQSAELLVSSRLSTEAGIFSTMALNAFIDAQQSFNLSIALLDNAPEKQKPVYRRARAEALVELGRVYRYQGKYIESEQSLQVALSVYENLPSRRAGSDQGVADTLHELGVLEVKKHNLDTATVFLEKSLAMRHCLDDESTDTCDSNSAATLHQLAAICVAKKPPSLEKAKALLQEALALSRQIGQRAATFKQLARVTIRQGHLDRADAFLKQALDLYLELYGDNKNHINIAAVKFQQGALALQQEQWDEAWKHLSECLRIRKNVYAYARPVGAEDEDPTHLEVSCVMHELARVAMSQAYYVKAFDTLKSERIILERLEESSDRSERIYQARLTNLTWLRKCAKAMGNEDVASDMANDRSKLKKAACTKASQEAAFQTTLDHDAKSAISIALLDSLMGCRLAARKVVLEKDKNGSRREDLTFFLSQLSDEIQKAPSGPIWKVATEFRDTIVQWKDQSSNEKLLKERRTRILKACDVLRDVLRSIGVQVVDTASLKRPFQPARKTS